jgi:general stress protein YciG
MSVDIKKAAQIMGRKGGKVTAQFGYSFHQEIGRKGGFKRWENFRSKTEKNVGNVNENQVVNESPA